MMLCDVIAEREAHLELVEHPNEKHGPSRKTNMDTLGILGTLSSFRIAYSYFQETIWPGANVA